ncbi:hypothetical protein TNCV_1882861 [Trichonephila clavipes]|nr:hypothetical protein TNCV_1882861 [Trichonephila clavipes]
MILEISGTTWDQDQEPSKMHTLIIRPASEYATPIWVLASVSSKPVFLKKASKRNAKITPNLLLPCSKKEDARILKQKGLETIEKISQENFAVAYTDGSSDISLNKGGAGILFQLPNKERKMHKINTGLIASNFTSELLAIKEALILYSTHLELSGTTKGLAIFSDSRATLETIVKGDTNITSAINVLLESLHCRGKSCLLQ